MNRISGALTRLFNFATPDRRKSETPIAARKQAVRRPLSIPAPYRSLLGVLVPHGRAP